MEEEKQKFYDKRESLSEFQPGIYLLWKNDEIVYVGKSLWARARVYHHERDKNKEFDSFTIIPYPINILDIKEIEYICKFSPKYNQSITSSIVKTKQGWAAFKTVKVGVIGRYIRKNKIEPFVILGERSYYHIDQLGGLPNV